MKGFILGAVIAGIGTWGYMAAQWYSLDNQEVRAYVEFLDQRDYYPPDIEPAKIKSGLPKLPEGYNARKDGPVWFTAEGLN